MNWCKLPRSWTEWPAWTLAALHYWSQYDYNVFLITFLITVKCNIFQSSSFCLVVFKCPLFRTGRVVTNFSSQPNIPSRVRPHPFVFVPLITSSFTHCILNLFNQCFSFRIDGCQFLACTSQYVPYAHWFSFVYISVISGHRVSNNCIWIIRKRNSVSWISANHFKPSCLYMYRMILLKGLKFARTVYLCASYDWYNKHKSFLCTARSFLCDVRGEYLY
jgi:hypothetical protein